MNTVYTKLMELIDLNKGIVLEDCKFSEASFCIQLCVFDPKTRMLIHYVSEASNTNLNTFAKRHPGELEPDANPDAELVYELRSKPGDDILDQASWLGAHFSWAMFKMAVISPENEKEFCCVFGAISKSA